MSDFLRDCLMTLRVFGPCSNAEVARRLKVPSHKTYRALASLVFCGFAVHPKLQAWDVSDKGRRWFQDQPIKPLALFV
jgi:DNA-binding IclR family transcriptional regulator